MSNLPTINTEVSFETIANIIGQDEVNDNSTNHELLKINRDHEDDDGNSIPAGAFSVKQGGATIYSKDVDLQIFLQRYQYIHYDPEANEFVSKAIQAKNLFPNTEMPDTGGTLRCGSVPMSQRESLSAEDALKQKQIKCFRMLYGKVYMKSPVDSQGKTVDDAVVPILWRARGSNFMPISQPLDSLSSQKKPFIFYKLSASLEKKKNGGLVYYVSKFGKIDGPVDFSDDDQALLKYYVDLVGRDNKAIMADYDRALLATGKVVDGEVLSSASLDDALNSDLSVAS